MLNANELDLVQFYRYYAGAEPNTLEYVQRHAKVILKFKQKVCDDLITHPTLLIVGA